MFNWRRRMMSEEEEWNVTRAEQKYWQGPNRSIDRGRTEVLTGTEQKYWQGPNRSTDMDRTEVLTGTEQKYWQGAEQKYWQGPNRSTYVYRFQNVLRCPTPRLHCFPSSHWPSFRFLSFMAFLIPSIQFFFGLPRALFCFGIEFNAILGNLPSAILWTWPYHVSWFCSISLTIGSSNPICCLIVTFLILSSLDIL